MSEKTRIDPAPEDHNFPPSNRSEESETRGNTGYLDQTELAAREPEKGDLEAAIKPSFKSSFWLVFSGIAIVQLFTLVLALSYGLGLEEYPASYYFIGEIGAVIWFVAFSGLVILHLRSVGVSPLQVFNLTTLPNINSLGQVIKYFLGCAVFVVTTSLLVEETELHLAGQPDITVALTFLSTVVLAPICEEMIFRGYLYHAMFASFKRPKERMVVNAMLFAAAHVFLVTFLLGAPVPYYIFVLGYLLAKLREDNKTIVPCILLHSLNNGLVFAIDWFKTFPQI